MHSHSLCMYYRTLLLLIDTTKLIIMSAGPASEDVNRQIFNQFLQETYSNNQTSSVIPKAKFDRVVDLLTGKLSREEAGRTLCRYTFDKHNFEVKQLPQLNKFNILFTEQVGLIIEKMANWFFQRRQRRHLSRSPTHLGHLDSWLLVFPVNPGRLLDCHSVYPRHEEGHLT